MSDPATVTARLVPRVGIVIPDALLTFLSVTAARAARARNPAEFQSARKSVAEVVRLSQRVLEDLNVQRAAFNAARPARPAKARP